MSATLTAATDAIARNGPNARQHQPRNISATQTWAQQQQLGRMSRRGRALNSKCLSASTLHRDDAGSRAGCQCLSATSNATRHHAE
jgi:hypothetical protein